MSDLTTVEYRHPERVPVYEEICIRISKGEVLTSICEDLHMPPALRVYDWLHAEPAFAQAYARARDAGFDKLAEECVKIAEDGSNDYMMSKDGPQLDREHVQRSKLRIETRLKLLAKWDPKRYGEKSTMDLNAVVEQKLPLPQLQQEISRMLAKGAIDVVAEEKKP